MKLGTMGWALVAAALALSTPALAQESAERPYGFTMGIGAGWDLPSPVDELNTASVRFRLPVGLTLEPRVELSTSSDRSEFGAVDVENTFTALTLAVTARWPLLSRGPVDWLIVGGAGIDRDKTDPDGSNNDTTDTTLGLLWGLGVEYWFGPRWVLSATATNPVLSRRTVKTESVGDDMKQTTTSVGAVFDPDVIVMLHLFY